MDFMIAVKAEEVENIINTLNLVTGHKHYRDNPRNLYLRAQGTGDIVALFNVVSCELREKNASDKVSVNCTQVCEYRLRLINQDVISAAELYRNFGIKAGAEHGRISENEIL